MNISVKKITGFLIILAFIQCAPKEMNLLESTREKLADKQATEQTVALFYNLKQLTKQYTIFGQQDYASNGHGWMDETGRCDVKDITGDYPGVNCMDFLHFTNPPSWEHKDTAYLSNIVRETYNRGGIITFCWHYYNPVTNNNFYDTIEIVKDILPGGNYNRIFNRDLKIIADFANNIKGADGNLIPIIFRPWHEFDGSWFWWGKRHCTIEEFKNLYRYTVTYLRDSLHVHNFLYAFSPDCKFHSKKEYLERYPGDEYVDLVGMDNYWDFTPNGDGLEGAVKKAAIVSKYARKKNKLSAITESGLRNIPDSTWFTTKFLKVIKSKGVRLTYAAIWRDEFAPYPGQPAAKDLIKLKEDPVILFESDLKNIYKIEKNHQ